MLIFLQSAELGEPSPALKILIPGYSKKSNFRGGTHGNQSHLVHNVLHEGTFYGGNESG